MAKFADLPDELKLQILRDLITPTQPVHLVQWRLWALQPDIRFADEDANTEISFTLLCSSALDDIFFQLTAVDAWRLLIPRVRWLVTSTSKADWKALISKTNLNVVQYASLLRKMETFFNAEVAHITVVIDERTNSPDLRGPAYRPRHWGRTMTGQVSDVMNTCSNLKSLHVKLHVDVLPTHRYLTVPTNFDMFYRSEAFHELWEVLASQYAVTDAAPSSFDELHVSWSKTCQRRGIELKITATMSIPAAESVNEASMQSTLPEDLRGPPALHEEDLTQFWDIPRCIKVGDSQPWRSRCWAGLEWAIRHQDSKRRGEQVERTGKHEAIMGPDCEC